MIDSKSLEYPFQTTSSSEDQEGLGIEIGDTNMRFPVELTPDDNGTILATVPGFPGATFGETEQEALEMARDMLITILTDLIERKQDIPAIPKVRAGKPSVALPTLVSMKLELYQAMRKEGIKKADLGRRLHVKAPQVDRLFNLKHASQVGQLEAAFSAIGRELTVTVLSGTTTLPKRRWFPHERSGTCARAKQQAPKGSLRTRSFPAPERL